MTPVPSDLGKLTVPQLKALCKERRITGYSKLSKAALLQKLGEVTAPARTTPLNDQARRGATAAPPIAPATVVQKPGRTPAYTETFASRREANLVHLPVQSLATGTRNTESTEITSEKVPLPIEPQVLKSSQSRTATNTTSTRKISSTKGPTHIDISRPSKRIRTSPKPTINAGHEPPALKTSTFQRKSLAGSSTVEPPGLPAQPKRSIHREPRRPPDIIKCSAVPGLNTSGPGRFKPLIASKPRPVEPNQANREPLRAPGVSAIPRAIDYVPISSCHSTTSIALSHISFPPKAAERKWVYRWAVILSSLYPADRQTCMLVSRTFRYAVYLSAVHILSRNYAGRRLDVVLEQHSRNMTNFWPYLRLRVIEVSERRHAFKRSFLGQYTDSIGYDPLSNHLWTSPDDEKQVDIAIRFVARQCSETVIRILSEWCTRFILTRMWFAASVGAYGHNASAWSRCVVGDVQEIVRGEIWQVIAQDNDTGESCSFYVLEATCEVIGQPSSPREGNTLGYCLRADWTAWISQQSRAPLDAAPRSLLDCVKWSNTEDYRQGISKAWLRRVQGQDADNIGKKTVAERYILASVVANGWVTVSLEGFSHRALLASISGKWMSTSAMAQEFAGLPGNDTFGSRTVGRSANTVNMYLPAHHHIESVHFTTLKGEALHGAVAVVQTPGREYYVLRDNGMQVGCEEEGIPEVWQRILGCDALGRAH